MKSYIKKLTNSKYWGGKVPNGKIMFCFDCYANQKALSIVLYYSKIDII